MPHYSIAVSSHLGSLSVSHTQIYALFKSERVNNRKGVGASHNDRLLQSEVRKLLKEHIIPK